MDVKERLLSELQILCKDTGLNFEQISQELSEFIGDEEVIDYCITRGPLPSFSDEVFDIMILCNKCLYDYEMKQQGALNHILPLRTIIEISESYDKREDEDYLSVHFRASSMGTGLLIQGKLAQKKDIRRFVSIVVKYVVGST